MKNKALCMLLALLHFVLMVSCQSSRLAEKQAENSSLPSRFRVDITYMTPHRYQSRQVMDFFLEVKTDTAQLCLPYMGDVYQPSMSRDGLRFTAKMLNVKKGRSKKGAEMMTFMVKHANITYDMQLTSYADHKVELYLRPSNAQDCWYEGEWDSIE